MSQFPPPRVPSNLVSSTRHPALKRFLAQIVDMQVADLRLLMRLPADELDPNVGCNLTTAAILLNMISGFSVWFLETEDGIALRLEEQERGHPLSRRRFLAFVRTYWPRLDPEPEPDTVAGRLYGVRNSLSHALGVDEDPDQDEPRHIYLAKMAYSLDDIVTRFERNLIHPLTVPVIEDRDGTVIVHLGGLYWSMWWMLREAIGDKADAIEARLSTMTFPEIDKLPNSTP